MAITRGLTPAERRVAARVFGDSLDYDAVVLKDSRIWGLGGFARATPWAIYFPHGTLARGGPNTSWLIHELAHTWQYARGVSLFTTLYFALRRVYSYGGEAALRSATGLAAFSTEQQAVIAADAHKILTGRKRGSLATYRPYLDEFHAGRYRDRA